MNVFAHSIKLVTALMILCGFAVAQDPQAKTTPDGARMVRISSENALILGEIGAVITEEKGIVRVLMMPPKEGRPRGMQEVDLMKGDEVGMAAGKRVKNIKELKEIYTSASVGESFKLGIRRDGQAHVVSFVKKSEKDMPQGGGMVIRRDGPGGDENSDVFPAFGIGIEKKGSDIMISETLPNAPKNIKKGDIIKTLNGKEIKSIADFNKEFDATKIGGTLTLELMRDGKQVVVAAPRPEPQGQMIMRRN
jgi:S1-C subfamily serine protease